MPRSTLANDDIDSIHPLQGLADEGLQGGNDHDRDLPVVAKKERRVSQPGRDHPSARFPRDVGSDQVEVRSFDVVEAEGGVRRGVFEPVQQGVLARVLDRQRIPVDHVQGRRRVQALQDDADRTVPAAKVEHLFEADALTVKGPQQELGAHVH